MADSGRLFFYLFLLKAVVQIQNKRICAFDFSSLSVVGIISDNIHCDRLKSVNKKFTPSAIYALDCTVAA